MSGQRDGHERTGRRLVAAMLSWWTWLRKQWVQLSVGGAFILWVITDIPKNESVIFYYSPKAINLMSRHVPAWIAFSAGATCLVVGLVCRKFVPHRTSIVSEIPGP